MKPCHLAKRALVVILVPWVLFSAGTSFLSAQTAIHTSPALDALIHLADQIYARFTKRTMQHFLDNVPTTATISLGLTMHGQKRIADQDPRYRKPYEALRLEVHEFLGELARIHNFTNPITGQAMTRESLARLFDDNASGEQNNWAVQNGLPDPGAVSHPLILDRVTPQSLAKLHLKDEGNEIRLLEQTAPPVRIQEAPPPIVPVPPIRQAVPSILGTWQGTLRGSKAELSISGSDWVNGFIATLSNPPTQEPRIRAGDHVLKLERTDKEGQFRGKYLIGRVWHDVLVLLERDKFDIYLTKQPGSSLSYCGTWARSQ